MNTEKVRQAKLEAQTLSGLLGSLAHASLQVDLYPASEAAAEYRQTVQMAVFDKWTDLQLAMEELNL